MAGVTDLIHAIRRGESHRLDQRFAFHVLDVLEAMQPRGAETFDVTIASTCELPHPMQDDPGVRSSE